jgi:hypothetical protein
VSTFFGGCGKIPAVRFYRVFELPLALGLGTWHETPQNAIKHKTNRAEHSREGKKNGEKAPTFFVMSPDGLFEFVSSYF